MRAESLLCQFKRRWVVTTDSRHGQRTYPNLIRALTVSRLHQAWVADVTYVRLPHSFVYLAAILEAFSRKVIDWALAAGTPDENAQAESFFKTLKVEEVYLKTYRTYEEAAHYIGRFIEDVYNARRLHSSIDYQSPTEHTPMKRSAEPLAS